MAVGVDAIIERTDSAPRQNRAMTKQGGYFAPRNFYLQLSSPCHRKGGHRGGRRGGRGGSHRRRCRLAQQITPPTHSRNVRARPLAKKNRPAVCFSTPSADRSAAGRHGGPGARWPTAYMRSAPPTPLYAARCLERKGEPRAPEHCEPLGVRRRRRVRGEVCAGCACSRTLQSKHQTHMAM